MTTTKTTTTPIDPRKRSIALATERGHTACSWSAQLIGSLEDETGALVNGAWYIESATSDARYLVIYEAATDDARCSCKSAQFNHACHHRGLGIIKGRALAAQRTPAGRAAAERHAAQDRADEENARCLGF